MRTHRLPRSAGSAPSPSSIASAPHSTATCICTPVSPTASSWPPTHRTASRSSTPGRSRLPTSRCSPIACAAGSSFGSDGGDSSTSRPPPTCSPGRTAGFQSTPVSASRSRIATCRGVSRASNTSSAIVPAPPSPSSDSPCWRLAMGPTSGSATCSPRHKRGTWVGPGRSRKSSAPDAQGVIHLSPHPVPRHLPHRMGQTPRPDRRAVSAHMPGVWRRHPPHRPHHRPRADSQNPHAYRRALRAAPALSRPRTADRLGRTRPGTSRWQRRPSLTRRVPHDRHTLSLTAIPPRSIRREAGGEDGLRRALKTRVSRPAATGFRGSRPHWQRGTWPQPRQGRLSSPVKPLRKCR